MPSPEGSEKARVSDDVMAAIYVIGRLPLQEAPVDMQHLYLVGGSFQGSPGYRGADFSGAALFATNFSGAELTNAVFDGAQMSDWESVGSERWNDGKLAIEWAKSKGWERVQYVVLFDWANLTNASFKGTSVAGASFEHADLTNTVIDQTDLSLADFQHARNLDKAIFRMSCFQAEAKPIGLSEDTISKLASPCP